VQKRLAYQAKPAKCHTPTACLKSESWDYWLASRSVLP